jgi:hypothetical protein
MESVYSTVTNKKRYRCFPSNGWTNTPIVSVEIIGMQDYLIGSISIIIERKKNLLTDCCVKYSELKCMIKHEIDEIKKQKSNYIDGNEVKISHEAICINLTNFLEEEDSRIDCLLNKDKPIMWEDINFERIKHEIQKSVNP